MNTFMEIMRRLSIGNVITVSFYIQDSCIRGCSRRASGTPAHRVGILVDGVSLLANGRTLDIRLHSTSLMACATALPQIGLTQSTSSAFCLTHLNTFITIIVSETEKYDTGFKFVSRVLENTQDTLKHLTLWWASSSSPGEY
jgi:hypothetical protein